MTTPRETPTGAGSGRTGDAPPAGMNPAPPVASAVPRAGVPRASSPQEPGAGWAPGTRAAAPDQQATTVLPAGPRPARPAPARPAATARPAGGSRPVAGRTRRARLSLRRIDPWSVFLFSLVAAVFLGVALVVAVAVLYAVLGSLGVTGSLNQLFAEVTGGNAATDPLFTGGRIIGGAAVLAAVNVVLLTLLATLGALLYNVCSSFTGGLELTFGERD